MKENNQICLTIESIRVFIPLYHRTPDDLLQQVKGANSLDKSLSRSLKILHNKLILIYLQRHASVGYSKARFVILVPDQHSLHCERQQTHRGTYPGSRQTAPTTPPRPKTTSTTRIMPEYPEDRLWALAIVSEDQGIRNL